MTTWQHAQPTYTASSARAGRHVISDPPCASRKGTVDLKDLSSQQACSRFLSPRTRDLCAELLPPLRAHPAPALVLNTHRPSLRESTDYSGHPFLKPRPRSRTAPIHYKQ